MATTAGSIAKPVKPISKMIWVPIILVLLILAGIAYATRDSETRVAGFTLGQMIAIEIILFVSGLMSGLSGFGFSAVGAATLLFMEPKTEVPLLQTLSTGNQLLSVEQLRADMPKSWEGFWKGPGFCILGGLPGAFAGTWTLTHLPAKQLMTFFGGFLVLYCLYSLTKPAGAKIHGFDGPITSAIVGFIGGTIGGFTAFPGAAVVVWTGLRELPKAQNRAIVQPYIIMSQLFSLSILWWHHQLGANYLLLLALTLPAVLPGTFGGVMLYRRISDVNFRRVSFFLLGLSGLSLLLKIYGAALLKLV
jgi:uncharacterized membrane protein YfcA